MLNEKLLKRQLNGNKQHSKGRGFNLTVEYIQALYDSQGGKCSLTGITLEHGGNSLRSMHIDRIDSSLGYVEGNVQLLCKFANLGKNHHSNEDVLTILQEIRNTHDN